MCDRVNNDIQVFRTEGTFVKQVVVTPPIVGGTTYDITFSPEPDQRFAYVVDGTNEKTWILDRASLDTVGLFDSGGDFTGQCLTTQCTTTDKQGDIDVGETW